MLTEVLLLLFFIGLWAFFAAAEMAFVSLTDAKIETMIRKRLPHAELIKKLKSNNRHLLITILIGNNIVNIAAASLATVIAESFFDSAVIGITTGVMTIIGLIFGDMIPKTYASNYPKRVAIFAAPYLQFFEWIARPIVSVFENLTSVFAGTPKAQLISEEELRALAQISMAQGTIEKNKALMLERLFKFSDITAKDIMTPRVNVAYMEKDTTVEEAINIILTQPHTRFPVYEKTPDAVVGFLHSRDLLLATSEGTLSKETSIEKIVRPILTVPKQMRLNELLKQFQKKQTHIANVMDEYGGTEGMVTLEDVLEELVGEITDEHDVSDNIIKRVDVNTIIVSGDEEIHDVCGFLNCTIPGDPLDSIAEIILDTLQKIPRVDTEIKIGNVICKVSEMKDKRIMKVIVTKTNEAIVE